jgi:hypothetical protein
MISILVCITFLSTSPASANGVISWMPPNNETKEFSQDVSIDVGYRNTFWKSQVYLGTRKMLSIAFGVKNDGKTYAEVMAYFDEGFSQVGMFGNSCTSDISRDPALDSIISCSVQLDITFPAKVNMSIARDSASEYLSRWSGYINVKPGGEKIKIGSFDFANANASISSILQYTYPVWITSCETTAPSQTAIFWQPTSGAGKFSFDKFIDNKCGPYQFILPENRLNVDGISIRLSTEPGRTQTYEYSLYEILYPDVWATAFEKGYSIAQLRGDVALENLKSDLGKQIQLLNTRLGEIQLENSQLIRKLTKKIVCSKGKATKVISGLIPVCPAGWKQK